MKRWAVAGLATLADLELGRDSPQASLIVPTTGQNESGWLRISNASDGRYNAHFEPAIDPPTSFKRLDAQICR